MRTRNTRTSLMAISICALLSMVLMIRPSILTSYGAAQQRLTDQDFLQKVALDQGIALERLQVVARLSQDYQYSGNHIDAAKVLDKLTGQVFGIAVDAKGLTTSLAAVSAAEISASLARFGKIDPSLHARLSEIKDDASLPVSICERHDFSATVEESLSTIEAKGAELINAVILLDHLQPSAIRTRALPA